MIEKTIRTKDIYRGKIVHLVVEEVRLPNGQTATREVVHHPGAAAVVALDDDDRVVMVRQYRKPVERVVLEIPAGKLDRGENPRDCIVRELREETGYQADTVRELVTYTPSPGYCDEVISIYLAGGLKRFEAQPDCDEFLEVELIPLEELLALIDRGEITDGKTVTGLLALFRLRARG